LYLLQAGQFVSSGGNSIIAVYRTTQSPDKLRLVLCVSNSPIHKTVASTHVRADKLWILRLYFRLLKIPLKWVPIMFFVNVPLIYDCVCLCSHVSTDWLRLESTLLATSAPLPHSVTSWRTVCLLKHPIYSNYHHNSSNQHHHTLNHSNRNTLTRISAQPHQRDPCHPHQRSRHVIMTNSLCSMNTLRSIARQPKHKMQHSSTLQHSQPKPW
jgi:hypothetical protein